ncbi:hypothetical protein BRADI_2g03876v3 [Brachypodium distachyon]|uniref:Uncharacterized protein n=1 Tax=Brachypodium distachyon TaxID=15368 RepID=A0A2K2D6R2_BRADI|nr:hypothetical protein BRADI_2g03876v3 [Brachypodium distachyon]
MLTSDRKLEASRCFIDAAAPCPSSGEERLRTLHPASSIAAATRRLDPLAAARPTPATAPAWECYPSLLRPTAPLRWPPAPEQGVGSLPQMRRAMRID